MSSRNKKGCCGENPSVRTPRIVGKFMFMWTDASLFASCCFLHVYHPMVRVSSRLIFCICMYLAGKWFWLEFFWPTAKQRLPHAGASLWLLTAAPPFFGLRSKQWKNKNKKATAVLLLLTYSNYFLFFSHQLHFMFSSTSMFITQICSTFQKTFLLAEMSDK